MRGDSAWLDACIGPSPVRRSLMHESHRHGQLAPLRVVSALAILVADIAIFTVNVLSPARAVPATVLAGSALCAGFVLWVERTRGGDVWLEAGIKAAIVAV